MGKILQTNINLLSKNAANQEALAKVTAILKGVVMSGDDTELRTFLQSIKTIIPTIPNHAAILNSAIDEKLIRTFAILIDHGFDPEKKDGNTINSLAYACKTQSSVAVQSYCDSIERKFGSAKAIHLLKEIHKGKDALNHAIDGKSFLSTVKFIIQKANPVINNLHLVSTAQKEHTATLSELLHYCQLGTQELVMLQDAIQYCDFSIQGAFIDYLQTREDSKEIEIKEIIAQAIENFNAKKENLTPNDIYIICLKSGPKAFEIFLSEMERRGIEIDFNLPDQDGKTPLFYAIEENCFDPTVDRLLQLGANPNNIKKAIPHIPLRDQTLDALSLVLKHKESETLGLLLRNNKRYPQPLPNETIRNCLEMILKTDLNALLYSSFISNIDEEALAEVSKGLSEQIIKQALACELDSDLFAKIKRCCLSRERVDLKKIMFESIDQKNSPAVQKLVAEFSPELIGTGITQLATEQKVNETSEATPLLEGNKDKLPYGSTTTKAKQQIELRPRMRPTNGYGNDNGHTPSPTKIEILDFALIVAERSGADERSEILKIVTSIYDAGFLSETPDNLPNRLKAIGIDPDKTTRNKPSAQADVSFCVRLMRSLGLGSFVE